MDKFREYCKAVMSDVRTLFVNAKNKIKSWPKKGKIAAIIGVIVVVLAGCWGIYDIAESGVPGYDTNQTGVIFCKDHGNFTYQQYAGFRDIVKHEVANHNPNLDLSNYNDDGLAVTQDGPETYTIDWGCSNNGNNYDTIVKVDLYSDNFAMNHNNYKIINYSSTL